MFIQITIIVWSSGVSQEKNLHRKILVKFNGGIFRVINNVIVLMRIIKKDEKTHFGSICNGSDAWSGHGSRRIHYW